jgi:sn-glycerol 3-phosphate transport system ATP-binding protein
MRLDAAGTVTGVRPESMRLADDGLAGTVESVEYLGADSLVAARAAGGAVIVRQPGHAAVGAGDAVRIAWEAKDEHHFDAQTGGRKP